MRSPSRKFHTIRRRRILWWERRCWGRQSGAGQRWARVGKHDGQAPLVKAIAAFFQTKVAPVAERETVAILALMEADVPSQVQGGAAVKILKCSRGPATCRRDSEQGVVACGSGRLGGRAEEAAERAGRRRCGGVYKRRPGSPVVGFRPTA